MPLITIYSKSFQYDSIDLNGRIKFKEVIFLQIEGKPLDMPPSLMDDANPCIPSPHGTVCRLAFRWKYFLTQLFPDPADFL